MFYFEIIVDSYAVVRNNTEISCIHLIQISPMIKSCKTIVKKERGKLRQIFFFNCVKDSLNSIMLYNFQKFHTHDFI